MPNRYVRASAIDSEPVNSLSWQGEVFYRRLINRADDFGRFTANTSLLRASLFPLQLDRVSVLDIERLLSECEGAGLCFRYRVQGKEFLVMNKWEAGRAKYSEYPQPPPDVVTRMKGLVYTRKHMFAHVPDSDTDSDPDTDSASDGARGSPVELPRGFPETADDAIKRCETIGCGALFATKTWNQAVGRGGRDSKDVPIRNFTAHVSAAWAYERERIEKTKNETNRRHSKPNASRSAGTANEGRAGDYANAAEKG